MHDNHLISEEFKTYLDENNKKTLLRFITCGSVDDGKSTLIGKLLLESKFIYEDQLEAVVKDSKKYGTTGENIDVALFVDGLSAEREQGITIDVAYRFFSTKQRKFVVIDAPGHEQYTRNMATGASHADVAIVMVDARKGILTQTRRHTFILSLLGIKHILLAVNKIDLVNYDEKVYHQFSKEYMAFAKTLGLENIYSIPVSALHGDNLIRPAVTTPWYTGKSILQYLEDLTVIENSEDKPFRMPIQWINRPNLDFRGFVGRVSQGKVSIGDKITILPRGMHATIHKIITYDGELQTASSGDSITCTLVEDVDISRGDVFAALQEPCDVTEQFQGKIIWMADKPMVPGRQYLIRQGTCEALCTPNKPKYKIDINTLEHLAANDLKLNEIGCCDFALNKAIASESYRLNRDLGGFILIDRSTHETVAAGMIDFPLRRSTNVVRQALLVDEKSRSAIKSHKPATLWLTGLSGAGKSAIANAVEVQLNELGIHTILLDGDNIRHGLNRDLGFTEADRAENIRRIAEVSKLMTEAGLLVIVAFISPFAAEREMAKTLIGEDKFFEIYVSTPLEVAEARDCKGLYKKARAGLITNFTGINSPYEIPQLPALSIDTSVIKLDVASSMILNLLREKRIID